MMQKGRYSSYRKTFGGQTAYSTAGSKSFGSRMVHEPLISKRVSYSYSSSGGGGGAGGASASAAAAGGFSAGGSFAAGGGFGAGGGGLEGGFSSLRLNEKELLNGLNSRFASYVEKVRYLEEQNQIIEKKIREASAKKEVDLGEEKRENLRKLRAQIDDATVAKVKAELARENLRGEASEIKWKLDFEAQQRQELDDELGRLRKDVDDATMVRVDLERKIETLREELEYNRKVHDEEIEDLKKQIANQGVNIEVDGLAPDVAELLRQIRAQYEAIVIQNRDEAEEWYKKKFGDLEEKAKGNQADLEKVQGDIGEYRKQVTQLEMELESLRGTNDYLERNLADVEKRYESEVTRYQDRLSRIGAELEHATGEMKRHLAEYKRLMSVKLSLEKEIRTYRRLLEGEGAGKLAEESSSESDDEITTKTKTSKKVIIKTIETKDGKIVSSQTSEKTVDRSSDSSSSDEE